MRRIAKSQYKKMPWKNGQGVTHEIDVEPLGNDGAYLWRLSQATIEKDSPFSAYPGQKRLLMVWKGEGLILNETRLLPLQPFRFSGDEAYACRLIAGPVEDLGLIFDGQKFEAEMTILEPTEFTTTAGSIYYIFDLATGDTLKIETPSKIQVQKSVLIRIQRCG